MVPSDKITAIKARMLIMLGDQDVIRLEHGIEMYRSIKGSEFAVLPNTTRFVIGQRPQWFVQIGNGLPVEKIVTIKILLPAWFAAYHLLGDHHVDAFNNPEELTFRLAWKAVSFRVLFIN